MLILNNRKLQLIVFSVIIGILSCVKIYSFDYWTHLYLGQQFYLNYAGSVVSNLFSIGGGLYSNFFPVALYSLSSSLGDSFVSVALALIMAATFALYFSMGGKIQNKNLPLFLLVLCLTFYFARIRLVPRPELIAYLLQALVMILLVVDEKTTKLRMFFVILLLIFWRATHVSWFFGLFFVFVYQFSEKSSLIALLRGFLRRKTILITMLTGIMLALFLLRGIFSAFIDNFGKMMHINEMQPLWAFPEYFYPYTFIFLLFVALNCLTSPPVYKRVVVLLVMYAFGVLIARNSVFFLFASLPYVINTCAEISWSNQRLVSFVKYGCVTAMVAIVSLVVLDKDPEVGLGIHEKFFPVKSMDYVAGNQDQTTIFNDLDWGGYVLWHSAGKIVPFVDGMLGASSVKFNDYGAIINAQSPGLKLSQYQIDTIVTRGIYLNSGRIYPLMFYLHYGGEWSLRSADDGLVFSRIVESDSNGLNKRLIWLSLHRQIKHLETLDGNRPHILYSKGIVQYMLGQTDQARIVFAEALNEYPELSGGYASFLRAVGL